VRVKGGGGGLEIPLVTSCYRNTDADVVPLEGHTTLLLSPFFGQHCVTSQNMAAEETSADEALSKGAFLWGDLEISRSVIQDYSDAP